MILRGKYKGLKQLKKSILGSKLRRMGTEKAKRKGVKVDLNATSMG
jgi:hypothetical protein